MTTEWDELVEKCQAAGARSLIHFDPVLNLAVNRGHVVYTFDSDNSERAVEVLNEMVELTSPPTDSWWVYTLGDEVYRHYLVVVLSPKDAAMFKLRLN